MKKWTWYQFSLFIVLCILLNYFGRQLAMHLQLPLWLDSLGTVLCAYLAGPVCGGIVGLTGNLMYSLENHLSAIYGLTSIALGVIVGHGAKKRALDTFFGTMTVSALAALAAILVSSPLNIFFSGGSTANIWGDGVIAYLKELGCPGWIAAFIGQFYIDFLDKFLTLMMLHLALRLIRRYVNGKEKKKAGQAVKAAAVLLALLLCAPGQRAYAEEIPEHTDYNDYVQTVYASSNGLPCGEANDIAQTNDGILWIGTYAGLYRYNGREFRWMDDFESVRNVNCLYVDEEGRLWIGTNDNGVSIAINETIANVIDQSRGLPSNSVRSIIQSSDGYYYIGTTGSMQILTFNGGLKKVNTLWEVNYADHIAADGEGRVAAVTSNGRLFLIKSGQILSSLQLTGGGEIFKSCCFTPDGLLLAGTTGSQIYTYDISGGGFEELSCITCPRLASINDLVYLEDGKLFITADNGVGYLDVSGAYHSVNTNDFNNSIDNMQLDYQGNLWFASSRLGLLRMAPSAFRDVYSTVGMSSRVVNAVEKWQGNYYFGTDKGLDIVNSDCTEQIVNELTEKLSGVRIRCMLVDSRDHLWICTYGGGLIELGPDGEEYLYDSESNGSGKRTRLVTELSDGTILAGGDTGMSFIRDHRVTRSIGRTDGLINSMILTATEMPDGTILAGTDGDGIAVLSDGQVERLLTRKDGLSSEVILRTVRDPKSDGVFIVTSNGLCYLDTDKTIRTLDNFPYFNNYDIWAKDENTLFVMSSAGIYVVDRDELLSGRDSISYDLLDSRRGLNSALTANSWNYYDGEGDLYLPCDTGVFIINADRYASSTRSYRMTVSSYRLDGEYHRAQRGQSISVSRGTAKIEMYPEIINYTIQDPYVGYYLEGFDTDWTVMPQASLGTIVYTNLQPGEYTFHLAVLDTNQQDILGERTYRIVKEKEIYDHPWFMAYLLTVPVIAVAWFTWFLVKRQMQRTLEKQEKELALARQQIQMGNETIFAIAKAVDAKDVRTSEHSRRVSEYSVMIAQAMGMSEEECESLRKAARMHDIGKIGIPDSILNKPARLTDDEYAVMKSHTVKGAEILKDFTLIDHVVEGARYHHERYDGRGYPDGLKGEEIPLYGRIIGVADAFDAMTANRVYRKQMDFDYVLNEMRNGRGTQFDPHIVDVMLHLIDEGKINLNEIYGIDAQAKNQAEGAAT